MEDRQGHPGAVGLGHGLRRQSPSDLAPDMKRISENGARPVSALGGLNTPPFGRLGALVFQPYNSESLWWASRAAQTRIAGCAWAKNLLTSTGKTFPSERRSPSRSGRSNPGIVPLAAQPAEISGGFAARNWISFSLWAVIAGHHRKTPGSRRSLCRERMHPQSTGGLSAQVALLQSLILSAAGAFYPFGNTAARQTFNQPKSR
jgi:hypothetical protein